MHVRNILDTMAAFETGRYVRKGVNGRTAAWLLYDWLASVASPQRALHQIRYVTEFVTIEGKASAQSDSSLPDQALGRHPTGVRKRDEGPTRI